MFRVGDRVVYPKHGAGVIESVEEREFLGEKQMYYIIKLPIGDMKVMVPTNNVEGIGLRKVTTEESVINEAFKILRSGGDKMSDNWNRRYRANAEKLRTGSIHDVAEVVRDLNARDKEKGLSTGEKKMLDNARQILISELILAKDIKEDQAVSMINEALT